MDYEVCDGMTSRVLLVVSVIRDCVFSLWFASRCSSFLQCAQVFNKRAGHVLYVHYHDSKPVQKITEAAQLLYTHILRLHMAPAVSTPAERFV
jgi:hypothetical protein